MTEENPADNGDRQNSGNLKEEESLKPICGIIRPISAMGDYSEQHWKDVAEILNESIREAGFEPKLVSDAAEVSVIQKTIVHNLYEHPIVICDVSGKNANVMFELGLRLAFDKPTIIIKDDETDYNFDTSVIEHLVYPRSLHYSSILVFKKRLREKLSATYKASKEDPNYSQFLKHFGRLIPAKIREQEVSKEQFIQKIIQSLESKVDFLISQNQRKAYEEENRNGTEGIADIRRRKFIRINLRLRQEELFQKLKKLHQELPHMNSALAVAKKREEIEKLERIMSELAESEEI